MDIDLFRQQLRDVDPSMLSVDDRLALIDLLRRCFVHHALHSSAVDGAPT